MKYALAVQLRDANYPYPMGYEVDAGWVMDDDFVVTLTTKPEWIPAEAVRMPTVAHLLKQLGDKLGSLTYKAGAPLPWIVVGADTSTYRAGENPDDALGALWLAIHTKPS